MEKLDLTKKYKAYFSATTKPEIVLIEPAQFLSLPGKGDPSGQPYADRIQALYATAYAVKFMFKERGQDFTVSKLECLWWFDEERYQGISMAAAPVQIPRSEWCYRLLIRMPEYVTDQEVRQAIEATVAKKQLELARLVSLFEMAEGKCVQIMHLGPFATEPVSLERMHQLIREHQFGKNGLHHEIYLSDFRKTAPEKLKTILREPVK